MSDTTDYDALAARAEAGELRPIPGTTKRGAEAAEAGRRLLMAATGTQSVEDATHVALGRPTIDRVSGRTIHWKVRTTETLDEAAKTFVREHDMNVSELVRKGVAEYIRNHSETVSH